MNVYIFLAIGIAAGLMLAGCDGGEEPSNVAYPDVRAAVEGGNAAAFDQYKGETIRWTGHVVEARRQFGDDYAQEGVLLVDMDASTDAGAQGLEPDVTFAIPPSKVPEMTAGQTVTFVGVVREVERGMGGKRLLRLELKSLEN